jgi:hypothetical protein
VICLKTKSKSAAIKASRSIASKLDDFWLQMRISDMDVPASHLLVKGKPKDAFTSYASSLSDALATYCSLKGADRTALFFTAAKRMLAMCWNTWVIDPLIRIVLQMLHPLGIG